MGAAYPVTSGRRMLSFMPYSTRRRFCACEMGPQLRSKAQRVTTFILICLLAGCAMQPISGPQDDPRQMAVHEGDTLRILTKDGQRRTVKVTQIDSTGVGSKEEHILFSDMVLVERRDLSEPDAAKTGTGIVLG